MLMLIHAHARAHAHACACVHMRAHACTCMHMRVHACTCVYMLQERSLSVHMHAHARTYMHMHAHAYSGQVELRMLEERSPHPTSNLSRVTSDQLKPTQANSSHFKQPHQRWHLLTGAAPGRIVIASAHVPGKVLAVTPATPPSSSSSAAIIPPAPLLHPGAFASRGSRLTLIDGDASTPAAQLELTLPAAEYPALALWTPPPKAPPHSDPTHVTGARSGFRSFLLLPLNEIVDERYTVYFCRLPAAPGAVRPPAFCG